MSEIWKDIYFIENGIEYDYRGLYQISNFGNVKSLGNDKKRKEKILKAVKNTKGYEQVNLCKNNKRKHFSIHRLVAFMFIEGYFEGAEVDHINTDRTDNRSCNLRWCSRKENCNNELSKKHYSEANKGENHPRYGKNQSEETRAKISEAWDNKSDEEKAEIRRKRSEANKGEKNPMYGKGYLVSGEKNGRATLVDRFTLNGQYLDTKYPFEYVEQMGFRVTGISNCCTGRTKSHKGFIFKYHKE